MPIRAYTHNGLDLGRFGDEVLAMADGTVSSTRTTERGKSIRLYHGRDEDGLRFYSSYGHLYDFRVKKGDQVKRGRLIGTVGATGKVAGQIPHLRLMTLKYSDKVGAIVISRNPHRFWLDGPGLIFCFDPAKRSRHIGLRRRTWRRTERNPLHLSDPA